MDSIDLIRSNLRRSEGIVLARITEMEEHAMVAPTPRGGCHTLWVLGHLAYIEGMIVQGFMLGHGNPLDRWAEIFDGADVASDPTLFPPFAEVLAGCREQRANTLAVVGSLSEADLDLPGDNVPTEAEELFGSYRAILQYASDHWYMHRGHLADARRAAGLNRAWY